jgi:hypothetical protein
MSYLSPPEIDDVTTTPQPRSTFEQRRLEPAASQPEGKRRARNTDARNEYCVVAHGIYIEPEAVQFQVRQRRPFLVFAPHRGALCGQISGIRLV